MSDTTPTIEFKEGRVFVSSEDPIAPEGLVVKLPKKMGVPSLTLWAGTTDPNAQMVDGMARISEFAYFFDLKKVSDLLAETYTDPVVYFSGEFRVLFPQELADKEFDYEVTYTGNGTTLKTTGHKKVTPTPEQ